jgi:hypothetical protein
MRTRATVVLATLVAIATVAGACSGQDPAAGLPTEVVTDGSTTTVPLARDLTPCDGEPGVGGAVPAGAAPGDLVGAHELQPGSGEAAKGFPTDARVWRILYVSTGVDETDLQLVCGLAAAPTEEVWAKDGVGRQLAWAHGTIGLQQACLPSTRPEEAFWAAMGSGIGAVAWGNGFRARNGDPADGALQTALDRGWVVSATDYQPNDTYLIGRIAAANVIDAARATSQLVAREVGDGAPERYDVVTWGHSQGGHAALWAGQLMDTYQQAAPNPAASLSLAGVAAEAPAANLIAQPERQDGVQFGDGVADWEMHKSIQLIGLPIAALELQIGPALFSYIFGSWTQFSARGAPGADARTPAFPAEAADLQLDAVATAEGRTTIAQLGALCLDSKDSTRVKELVSPYRDAAEHRMLTPDLWNLPDDYRASRFFHGGVDRTCATTADADMAAWCDWIRWNIPGPLGDHPFPTTPQRDGRPAPVLIAQGMDDEIIHCQPADGEDPRAVPDAANCMATALYDALRDDAYCPSGTEAGHLQLALFAARGAGSPASHLSIPGQIAAVGSGRNDRDLSFTGSPLDRFMTGAFEGRLESGCTAAVLNRD